MEEHGPGRQPGCSFCIPERAWTRASQPGRSAKPVAGGIGRHGAVHQAREALRRVPRRKVPADPWCPGLKVSTTTSARHTAEGRPRGPRSLFRSITADRGCDSIRDTRVADGRDRRPGGSIFTTSAPKSASSMTPTGPAMPQLRSSTLTPPRVRRPCSRRSTRRSEAITSVSSMTVGSATFGRKPNRKTEMLSRKRERGDPPHC